MKWLHDFKTIDLRRIQAPINNLVNAICQEYPQATTTDILSNLKVFSAELPRSLRKILNDFKLKEDCKVLKLRLSLDGYTPGKTPFEIAAKGTKETMSTIEILHALMTSLLGEIFTWSSIQNGNIVNEVFPIKANIDNPISSGTSTFFDLHTEDGFHPLMGDYLSLFCVRNPNKAATVLSTICPEDLPNSVKSILFQERFFVGANIAHDVKAKDIKMPILFGNPNAPYLRINLNNIKVDSNDAEAAHALKIVSELLRANTVYEVLEAGDLIFIDNFRVVHGRDVYTANYDGNDRWLKRFYVTNDLRKSRHMREVPESRTIIVT